MANSESPANSLGLDFDQLKIQDPTETESKPEATPQSPSQDAAESTEKKKPYVNPERVKTGGNQRDKLSEEALSERMARMREQNEKIKQRRLDVQADEEAFKKTQETERIKLAQIRKVQEGVDRTREQNAKRKLDKMQSREWDSGKPAGGNDWKRQTPKPDSQPPTPADEKTAKEETTSTPSSPPSADSGGWTRGGSPRGSPSPRPNRGGRGRGRGRGGPAGGLDRSTGSDASPSVPAASAPAVVVSTAPAAAPKEQTS
ncbi:hypothetical protein DFH07DRAFT_844313 [Mycena maculata]|uniref:Uncharacterized protein n=1 Tax=Mycena maculata TaxID=230809 RepID=A0AAD7I663_9AGAR|nr:hypothetical protein DFH07DRAFT_844313 [Mycena maculata]